MAPLPLATPLVTPALAASAPGIGDLCYLSPEWVEAARKVLTAAVEKHKTALADLGKFTLCEVAHNPPWHSSPYGESYKNESRPYTPGKGPGRTIFGCRLAWWVRFDGSAFTAGEGELPGGECDLKVQGDHGIMSRLARVRNRGNDPALVAAARAQLQPQSKWVVEGKATEHGALAAVLEELHDAMAERTIPRFVWMTPEWVSCAREIITTRAANPKFAERLKSVDYLFAEEFQHPPRYAAPDGASGGFWVSVRRGRVAVGSGSLPAEHGEPDVLTRGEYVPILAGGRTVNAALTAEEQKLVGRHQARLPKTFAGRPTMTAAQRVRKGSAPMPAPLGLCMMPLHDELSLRASGEVPSDFDPTVPDGGAPPFDRSPEYQGTWLRYDKVDVYGRPLVQAKL